MKRLNYYLAIFAKPNIIKNPDNDFHPDKLTNIILNTLSKLMDLNYDHNLELFLTELNVLFDIVLKKNLMATSKRIEAETEAQAETEAHAKAEAQLRRYRRDSKSEHNNRSRSPHSDSGSDSESADEIEEAIEYIEDYLKGNLSKNNKIKVREQAKTGKIVLFYNKKWRSSRKI